MTDISPSIAERENEADSELLGIRDVVSKVYKSVWEDFSVWEQDHCRQTLRNLSLSRPFRPHLNTLLFSSGQSHSALKGKTRSTHNAPSTVVESFDDSDMENGSTSTVLVTVHTISKGQILQPLSYEACTPISQNLMIGDDSDYLPFIPNSDDPTYDCTFDIGEHKFFAWHQCNRDPDLEVINIETTRSLLQDHGMSVEDIDRSRMLPLPVDEIIRSARRRDMPKWRSHGPSADLSQIVSRTADSPKGVLDYFLSTFCNNFNCLTGYCTTHLVDTHLPNIVPPKIPYSKTHESVKEPCGLECFLQAASSSNIPSFWAQRDVETLFSILDYSPDTLPCDLAIICRKPCREVYRQRALYHREPLQIEKGKQLGSGSFDERTSVFVPNRPCKHDGPCDSRSNCPCFVNKAHCRNTCRCTRTCLRRWKGCTCAKTGDSRGEVCGTKRCSCFRANVECDPDVCLSCGTKSLDDLSKVCKNGGIRRGEFKITHVRQSTWGLGLFMSEPCQKGDLISEYVGELIFEPTFHSRDGVAVHKGRSYVFELNSTFSLDSGLAGNETRYINHSSTPNCSCIVMLVNGEHRIGIYASTKILEGEELFINYGPNFFPKTKELEVEEELKPTLSPKIHYSDDSSDSTYFEDSDI